LPKFSHLCVRPGPTRQPTARDKSWFRGGHAPGSGTLADERPLELGDAREHGQHYFARRCRGIVARLDRLARSTRYLLELAEAITAAGASLKSLGEPWAEGRGCRPPVAART
jgi:hypothetical protein